MPSSGGGNVEHQIFEKFESAWRAGERPDLAAYLNRISSEPFAARLVFNLASVDLDYRLNRGDGPSIVGEYIELPLLVQWLTPDQQAELVRLEYQSRWRRGERGVSREQYRAAFPKLATLLSDLTPTWECCNRCQSLRAETDSLAECIDCGAKIPVDRLFHRDETGFDLRRYELTSTLGAGGMGQVFRAIDPGLGRELAVKVIHSRLHDDPVSEERFKREAKILSRLEHPGIVPVHNVGRLPDGRLFMTMKLVEGETLFEKLYALYRNVTLPSDGGASTCHALLPVFAQVCQAVAYAHQCGVVHRDLTPRNIMVGRFGEAQVMDWGLAREIAQPAAESDAELAALSSDPPNNGSIDGKTPIDLTEPGRRLGTLHYMPKEQAGRGASPIGPAADVFALGAILCEILTGLPPYWDSGEKLHVDAEMNAETRGAQLDSTKSAENLALFERWRCRLADGDVGPGLARLAALTDEPELIDICRRCLAAEPAERFLNAGELLHRLNEHTERVRQRADEKKQADVRAQEAEKTMRASIAGVVVAAALLIVGIVLWQKNSSHVRELEQRRVQQLLASANEERNRAEGYLGLPWFGAALRESRDPVQRANLRRTILTTLPLLPKVQQIYLHEAPARTYEFSAEGKFITTSAGKQALLWPVVYGQAPPQPIIKIDHERDVYNATVNKSGDRMLTMAEDGKNRLYSIPDGKLLHVLAIEGGDIFRSAFDPSGKWALGTVGISRDGFRNELCIWETATGSMRYQLPHAGLAISNAVFSPDESQLASIAHDTVWLWDLKKKSHLKLQLQQKQPVQAIAFSNDGRLLAAGSTSQAVETFDVRTGASLQAPLKHPAAISNVWFSDDDQLLIVKTGLGTMHVWDLATRAERPALKRIPANMQGDSNQTSSDGRQALNVDSSGRLLRLLGVANTHAPEYGLQRNGMIHSARLSPDSRYLAAVSLEEGASELVVLHRNDRNSPFKSVARHGSPLVASSLVEFSADSKKLYVGSGAGIFTIDLDKPQTALPHGDQSQMSAQFALDATAARAYGAGLPSMGPSEIWQFDFTRPEFQCNRVLGGPVSLFFLGPKGTRLLTLTQASDRGFELHAAIRSTAGDFQPIPLAVSPAASMMTRLSKPGDRLFSPNERLVALPTQEGTVAVCSTLTGALMHTLPTGPMTYAEFDPTGNWLLAHGANTLQIWDTRWRLHFDTTYANGISQARFSPDGRLIAVASGNLAHVMDVAAGESTTPYWTHDGMVGDVHFSDDGRYVLTTSFDKCVRLWNIEDNVQWKDGDLADLAEFVSGNSIAAGKLKPLSAGRAEELWSKLIAESPQFSQSSAQDKIQYHWEQVHACEQACAWKHAIEHLNVLLASGVDHISVDLWRRRGYAYAQLKQWPDSERAYRGALKLSPKDAKLAEWLAHCQIMQGQRKQAAESYLLAESFGLNEVSPLRNMANNYVYLGEYALAAKYYHKVRAMQPDQPSHWRSEAAALVVNGQMSDYQKLLQELSAAAVTKSKEITHARDIVVTYLLHSDVDVIKRGEALNSASPALGNLAPEDRFWLDALLRLRMNKMGDPLAASASQSLAIQPNQVGPREWLLLAMNAHHRGENKLRDEYIVKVDEWLASARSTASPAPRLILETLALRREYNEVKTQTPRLVRFALQDAETLRQQLSTLNAALEAAPIDTKKRGERGAVRAWLALIDPASADWKGAADDFTARVDGDANEADWWLYLGLCLRMVGEAAEPEYEERMQKLFESASTSSKGDLLFSYLWLAALYDKPLNDKVKTALSSEPSFQHSLEALAKTISQEASSPGGLTPDTARTRTFQLMLIMDKLDLLTKSLGNLDGLASSRAGPDRLFEEYISALSNWRLNRRREARDLFNSAEAQWNQETTRSELLQRLWYQQVELHLLRRLARAKVTAVDERTNQ